MKSIRKLAALVALFVGLPASALAATAVATVDVNIRTGPGPEFPVTGMIAQGAPVELMGCIVNSAWCQVNKDGTLGWSYGEYLSANVGGQEIILANTWQQAGIPAITYVPPGGQVYAPVRPAGRLIAPVRRVLRGPAFTPPPPAVQTYVIENRQEPIILDGEVVVGAGLPDDVRLYSVPEYEYQYAYVNQVPVLVQPDTRRVVYVYR